MKMCINGAAHLGVCLLKVLLIGSKKRMGQSHHWVKIAAECVLFVDDMALWLSGLNVTVASKCAVEKVCAILRLYCFNTFERSFWLCILVENVEIC